MLIALPCWCQEMEQWNVWVPNGTGQAEAAVFNLIQEWNLADHIKFMCFDITAAQELKLVHVYFRKKKDWKGFDQLGV